MRWFQGGRPAERIAFGVTVVVIVAAAAACSDVSDSSQPAAATPSASSTQVGPSSSIAPLPPPGETTRSTGVILYRPARQGAGTSVEGSCFGHSLAAPYRSDGWRCLSGDIIQDPCFAIDDGSVECGMNPATGEPGFVLRVTKPLPQNLLLVPGASNLGRGWMVQLADGAVCRPVTGASGTFDGKRANYNCSSGRWILGDLVPGSPWTADVVRDPATTAKPGTRETVAVAFVWR